MTKEDEEPDPEETALAAILRRIAGTADEVDGDRGPEPVPRRRPNLELFEEIARGGMGIVLKGRDSDLRREVAVKVLDDSLARDPAVLQRFVEEAQIGGQLQHPGVVPIYELGVMEDGRPFFAMKLIQGDTLAELLAARADPDQERRHFLAVFESVCQTVAYAHSKGVIHRDLKPANVMVGAFGEVQVVDWGLAKVLGGPETELGAEVSPAGLPDVETMRSGPDSQGLQSVVGSALGTPAYMAPEQALGRTEEMDERTDVFALGGILCEVLTGAPPYQAREGEHTVVLAANAELAPALARIEASGADGELKELCRDCLSVARDARPRNAGAVARRVQDYLAALEEKAHRAELAATEARELRRRQRLVLGLVSTVFVSVLAIGLALRFAERQRQEVHYRLLVVARQQLDDAADEIGRLQDEGRFDDAVEAARAAAAGVASGEVDDEALVQRARRMVSLAEERSDTARRRSAIQRRNEEFLARGSALHAKQMETFVLFSPPDLAATLDREYLEVFRNYGIDLVDDDPVQALDDLVAIEVGWEIGLVLDDWADLRRRLYGPASLEAEAVTVLALDLDPDPWRTRLREALLAQDVDALLAFLEEVDLARLHPGTLFALAQGLDALGHDAEYFAVLRAGASLHPDDFLLNARVGQAYASRGANFVAATFLSSAVAARPKSAAAYALLGESLRAMGDLPRAAECYAESLRLEPAYTPMRINLAWLQVELGDFENAAEGYEDLARRFPEESVHDFRHLVVRYLMGEASREDVLDRLAMDRGLSGRDQTAAVWALAFHPDPARRDPRRVIAIQDSWGHEEPATEATEATALLQLGRPEEALAVLARGEGLGQISAPLRARYAVLRARAHLELGDEPQARRFLAIAEAVMKQFMYDGFEPWARTPLVRAYRETRDLLGD